MWRQMLAAFLLLLAIWTCDLASGKKKDKDRGSRCCAERLDKLLDNVTELRGEVNKIEDVQDKLETLGQTALALSDQVKRMEKALTVIQNGIALKWDASQLPPLIRDKLVRDSEGYYLAFRLTAGIKKPAYVKYVSADYSDDESDLMYANVPCGCRSTNGSLYCDRHYRSMLMDSWPHLPVHRVKVSLYKQGVEKRRFVFDGTGSDKLSFFSKTRLVSSPYDDLSTSTPNFFSIIGDNGLVRRFFINNNYGGCPNDRGWLVVGDRGNSPCPWEKKHHSKFPFILYAANIISSAQGYTKSYWESANVGEADVLTVSIKLRDREECPADSN